MRRALLPASTKNTGARERAARGDVALPAEGPRRAHTAGASPESSQRWTLRIPASEHAPALRVVVVEHEPGPLDVAVSAALNAPQGEVLSLLARAREALEHASASGSGGSLCERARGVLGGAELRSRTLVQAPMGPVPTIVVMVPSRAPDEPVAVAYEPALDGERYSVRVEVRAGNEPTVVGAVFHREQLDTAGAFALLVSRVAPVLERAAARADDEGERRALERAAAQVRAAAAEGRAVLLDNPPNWRDAPREGFAVHVRLA